VKKSQQSKGSWKIKLGSRLIGQLRTLNARKRKAVEEALVSVGKVWGDPHSHAGAGIRKLAPQLFEYRAGLNLRLLFLPDADRRELVFVFVGNHDEIRRILRNK